MKKQQALQKYTNEISQQIYTQRRTLLISLGLVFFWGMLAHAYGFLHCNLSHDVLNAFIATKTEERWKIELGRFFVPVYRMFFRGAVTIPWIIGVLGLFWTSMAVFLVYKILNIKSFLLMLLTAGVMTTNVTYISQIATYVYEFDFNAFALMCALLAAYLWKESEKKHLFFWAASVFLMLSIGIYQAFISVTLTMIVWCSIMDLLYEKEIKEVFRNGIRGVQIVLTGGILYFIVGKIIYTITGIALESRTNVFDFGNQNPVLLYLHLIKPAIAHFLWKLFYPIYGRNLFPCIVLGVTVGLSACVVKLFIDRKFSAVRIGSICLLVIMIPFAMNCTFFLARGKEVHDLMVYASWFFYIFLLQIAFWVYEQFRCGGKTGYLRILACLIIFFFLGRNVTIANTAYIKKELEANATLSTMTRVVSMMEQNEQFSAEETPVAFVGRPTGIKGIYEDTNVHEITGLGITASISQDASLHYYNAYNAYFRYVLQYPIQICDDETHKKIKEDPRVEQMKPFPDTDCMALIEDVLVVKMS